ncbi:MAG: hypothetical protein ACREMZ_15595 [Gemmatimonadales bacterium]
MLELEAEGVERHEEYRAHHLPADIDFRGHAINTVGAEPMVLTREPDEWKIRAIHWSSRRRPRP